MPVTHLAQYLLRLDPQKNVARLSFYHYLKNMCDIQGPFIPGVLEDFYSHALTFQYWQTHYKALSEVVSSDLEAYFKENSVEWELNSVSRPDQTQIVHLERLEDLDQVIHLELEPQMKNGDRLRVMKLSENRMMAIWLTHSGLVRVRVYGTTVVIKNGILTPLAPFTSLDYNSQLELQPKAYQLLETSMMTIARFRTSEDGCHGQMIRGYSFQKCDTIQSPSVARNPELFYTLKKIERHYVKKESDPFYQELVSMLEKAHQLLNSRQIEGPKMGEAVLQRARMALKNIFPNDKLLLILVTNVEYLLQCHQIQMSTDKPSRIGQEEQCQEIKPISP